MAVYYLKKTFQFTYLCLSPVVKQHLFAISRRHSKNYAAVTPTRVKVHKYERNTCDSRVCMCISRSFHIIRIHFHFFFQIFSSWYHALSVGRFTVKIIKNLHNINFLGNLTATQNYPYTYTVYYRDKYHT